MHPPDPPDPPELDFRTVAFKREEIGSAGTLFEKRGGYLFNDMSPPGVWMDNVPEWEMGTVMLLRDTARVYRNDFSRSQSQSLEDRDLQEAEGHFFFDASSWLLPQRGQCLPRSIAFLKVLLAAGLSAKLVIGVSASPFSAHCWVQMSGGQDYILFDVETRGSLAGALRCYNAANVLVENCSATRTHSDSFHIVQGSSFATCRRLQIYDSGDDAISFIQYTNAPGGAQPRNMLIEECRLKGSRARGFTSVSGRDILWRNCKVEDVTLSGFLFGAKTAHSLSDCSGIKVRNCEAWRCGRMQAPNPNSGPFATLFSTSLYRCLNVEFTDCQAFVYGDDWYKTGFIRESDGFGGGGIQYSQTNCGVTVLDRAA